MYTGLYYTYWVYPPRGDSQVDTLVDLFKGMQLDILDRQASKSRRKLTEGFSDREMGYKSIDILNEKFDTMEVEPSERTLLTNFSSLDIERKLSEVKGCNRESMKKFKKEFGFEGFCCPNGAHIVPPCSNCTRPMCKHESYNYGYEPCRSCDRTQIWRGPLLWGARLYKLDPDGDTEDWLYLKDGLYRYYFLSQKDVKEFADTIIRVSGIDTRVKGRIAIEIAVTEGPHKNILPLPKVSSKIERRVVEEYAKQAGGSSYFLSAKECIQFIRGYELTYRQREMRRSIDRCNNEPPEYFRCHKHVDIKCPFPHYCNDFWFKNIDHFRHCLTERHGKEKSWLRDSTWVPVRKEGTSPLPRIWKYTEHGPGERRSEWVNRLIEEGFPFIRNHWVNMEFIDSKYPIPGELKVIEGMWRFVEQHKDENLEQFHARFEWITSYDQLLLDPVGWHIKT